MIMGFYLSTSAEKFLRLQEINEGHCLMGPSLSSLFHDAPFFGPSQVCSFVALAPGSWTYIKFLYNTECFRVSSVCLNKRCSPSHYRYSPTLREKNVLTFYGSCVIYTRINTAV
jgi:hypothetical protein